MFWMIEAFTCKETWKKTLKDPGIWIMIIVLALMFISSRAYAGDCDYLITDYGTAINPEHIAYMTNFDDHSEISFGEVWRHKLIIVMADGAKLVHSTSHLGESIDRRIRNITEILNKCKEGSP